MKSFSAAAAAVLSVAAGVCASPVVERDSSSGSLTPVTTKGNAFFAGNNRFFVRGVDYQPGGSSQVADPIADVDGCKRDIAYFQKLGINTIRVYTVDNTADHDECMSALDAAGIYLVLDVNTPKYSLNRADPAISYNSVYLQSIFATIDAFAKYNNVLAFFSGNEVINDDNTTTAAPYVKAVTRDMRSYLSARGYRQIPVGYSAADIDSNRLEMAEYMNCGSNGERSDFFAANDYSYCAPSSFNISGWDQKVKNFTGYGIPLFLSEYGCITNLRTFEEVADLYSSEMTAVYSGGLVYEYSNEGNGYGLVDISGDTVTITDQFTYLQKAYAKTPNPTGDAGYNSTGGASNCPPESPNWQVSGDALPAFPNAAEIYMKNGAGKGPGLTGPGSQSAGNPDNMSSGTATSGNGAATVTGTRAQATSSASGTANGTHTGKSAAHALEPFDRSSFYVGALVSALTIAGAFLL